MYTVVAYTHNTLHHLSSDAPTPPTPQKKKKKKKKKKI